MTHVASARLIGHRPTADQLAQTCRNLGYRGPISLAEPNPQPYDDIDHQDEEAS